MVRAHANLQCMIESKFILEESQKTRLKILENYIKKMEAVSPLNETQLFVIEGNKLTIYGYGNGTLGSGYLEMDFVVSSTDSFVFSCKLSEFLTFINKLEGAPILVTLRDNTNLVFQKSGVKSTVFTKTVLATVEDEVEEVKNAIKDWEDSSLTSATEVDLSKSHTTLETAASLLSLLGTNRTLKIDGGVVKAVDDCSIIGFKTDITASFEMTAPAVKLLHEVDKISIDGRTVYADIKLHSLKLLFVQEETKWQCPTDDEIKELSPRDETKCVAMISADALFKAFDEFKGIFVPARWQYKQVRVTPGNDVWQLHFDDMVTSIDSELPVSGQAPECSFMLPFMHLDLLSDMLKGQQLKVEFSPSPDEVVVSFIPENGFDNLIITKLQD